MKEKHIKFIDFVFEKLSKKYGDTHMLTYLCNEYQELYGIEIKHDETRFLEDKYFGSIFDEIGNVGAFKLSTTAIDIIENYGSYSNYIKENNKYINRQKEIEDLNFKISELQIDNLKYEKSNQELKTQILTLDKKAKKWDIIKSYWWLITILLAIVILAGDILDIITP